MARKTVFVSDLSGDLIEDAREQRSGLALTTRGAGLTRLTLPPRRPPSLGARAGRSPVVGGSPRAQRDSAARTRLTASLSPEPPALGLLRAFRLVPLMVPPSECGPN